MDIEKWIYDPSADYSMFFAVSHLQTAFTENGFVSNGRLSVRMALA